MRVALINVTASMGTGRFCVELCRQTMERGHRALLCHARGYCPGDVPSYRIGWGFNQNIALRRKSRIGLKGAEFSRAIHTRRESIGSTINSYSHILLSRLTDRQGFFSKRATKRLVNQLRQYKPDVIHLHNIHGSYLHLPTLFEYLKTEQIPTVWTLHDLWAITGHCAFPSVAGNPFLTEEQEALLMECGGDVQLQAAVERNISLEGCRRWLSGCGECAMKREYPKSWFFDRSARNWQEKRGLFTGHPYMVLTAPSMWLSQEISRSYLGKYPLHYLPHGLDMHAYKPCVSVDERISLLKRLKLWEYSSRPMVLSVSSLWEPRKGLEDLLDLSEMLGKDYLVVAVGLDEDQRAAIPDGSIVALPEMGNRQDLCALYTAADLFLSLSRAEAMGMRLLQALACGTQVLCWDATSLPEIVTPEVGETAPLGDLSAVAEKVRTLCAEPKSPEACRNRAMEFEAGKRNRQFVYLYEGMHENGPAAGVFSGNEH